MFVKYLGPTKFIAKHSVSKFFPEFFFVLSVLNGTLEGSSNTTGPSSCFAGIGWLKTQGCDKDCMTAKQSPPYVRRQNGWSGDPDDNEETCARITGGSISHHDRLRPE